MENAIIIIILAAIVGGIIWYLIRAKRRGEKCIGCPYARECGGNCNGRCGHTEADKDNDEK